MNEHGIYWHAVITASRAEKKVRERLEAEDVECFLPVQTIERQWTHRKAKVVVPVISGMIFVRVAKIAQVKVLQTKGVVSFLRLRGGQGPAVIPEKQMEAFRFLLDLSQEAVEMVNENVEPGDLIQVIKGSLKGLEGELVTFRGKTKVAVRIEQLGCAVVDIPSTFVERIR